MAHENGRMVSNLRITPATSRQQIAAALGLQYDSNRDVYEAAGYKREPEFADFYAFYDRLDIAARVIEEPPDECFRKPPEIWDGTNRDDASQETPFVQDVMQLISGRDSILNEMLGLYHYLHQLDIKAQIGQYAVMLIGLNDDSEDNLSKELVEGSAKGLDSLLYFTVFDELNAEISTFNEDVKSPRFGLPEMYKLKSDETEYDVHWSRVIHASQGHDIYGRSALRSMFNRLTDLEKVMAAVGESGWRMLVPGYALMAREGYQINTDDESANSAVEDYVHNLTRVMDLEGVDLEELTTTIPSPSDAVMTILKFISGTSRIPLRRLLGNEAGELASSQDDRNFADYISQRQSQYVEPVIIRRTLNRLIYAGVISAPTAQILVRWPNVIESTDQELAQIGDLASNALGKIHARVDPVDFVTSYYPHLDPNSVEQIEMDPEQIGTSTFDASPANAPESNLNEDDPDDNE